MKRGSGAGGIGHAPDEKALEGLLDRWLEKFFVLFARVLSTDDPDAVHDLRVWSRRVQQWLDSVHPKPRPKRVRRLRRTLRRMRRALGEWRNYDVVLELLGRRRRAIRSPRKRFAWDQILEVLRSRRLEEMTEARRRLAAVDLTRLQDALGNLAGRAGQDMTVLRSSLRASVASEWADWQAALVEAESTRDAAAIHQFRIASKRVRYSFELAHRLGDPDAEAPIEWFKRLQEALGEWHDRIVLRRLVAQAIARPEWLVAEAETARTVLAEIARDRDGDDRVVDAIFRSATEEAGRETVERWLAGGTAEAAHRA